MKDLIKNNLAVFLLIFAAGLAVHSTVLNNPFKTLDDKASILNNPQIKSLKNVKDIFTTSFFGGKAYYRPLVSLSFMLNYHFSKEDPYYYNLVNLVLHLLSGVVIFLLLERILLGRGASFFCALLFVIHPVHWEAVSNIPGRAILLSAFFSLLAFYLFVLSDSKGRRYFYYLLSLLSFTLSILSKESGCMLPFVLAAYLAFLSKAESTKSQKALSLVPFFAILAAYIILRKSLGVTQIFYWPSLSEHILGVSTFLRAVVTYVRMIVFPYDLHFDRTTEIFTGFHSFGIWATWTGFIAFFGLLIMNRKKISNVIWFFLIWFLLELFPVSQVVGSIGVTPGYISTAEHFLYVPSISLFVFLVMFGKKAQELNNKRKILSPSFLKIIFAVFFTWMAIITVEQEIYSSREFSMFERALKFNPYNSRIRLSLALGYAEKGFYKQAEEHFREALIYEPKNVRARIGLGKALCDQGKYIEGIQEYESIHDPGALAGILKENLNLSYDFVIEKYHDRIEQEKDNPQLYYSLGVLYAKKGDLARAVKLYEKTLSLDPYHKEALFNIASAYDNMQDREKAQGYYLRLIRLKGNLGELRVIANRRLEAINKTRDK